MRARTAGFLLSALLAGCSAGPNRPGFVVLPDMDSSVPYDAYDPNPVLPRGQTLMLPPEGTVPVDGAPFPYGPGPEEAARAGVELANPLTASAAELARGQREFANKCAVCHGASGAGDGPIIGRFPNPPSLVSERARGLADGHLYHIIARGQGIMPSHAAQVLPEDRWRLVLHIRQLQGPVAAPVTDEVSTAAGGAP